MISSTSSRAFWIGASDVKFVMSNWKTSTFMSWWTEKLGVTKKDLKTIYLVSGRYKEHQIANHYAETHNEKVILDRQVKLRQYRLRVNLDCETKKRIIEIKTHKFSENDWKLPIIYWQQCQVQMFATGKRDACIYAYAMKEEDYENFFLPIDEKRIAEIPVEYNADWINHEYLPRLVYLSKCLKTRKTPNYDEFLKEKEND